MRPRSTALLAAAAATLLLAHAPGAKAYEASSTHPGITAQAALASKIHLRLRRDLGQSLGIFTRLELAAPRIDPRELRRLRRTLERLDPAGGYQPDSRLGQRALGWLLAGSVLAGTPPTRETDHFLNPIVGGLDNRSLLLDGTLSLASLFEGSSSVREYLTGTGFSLEGSPATALLTSEENRLSATVFYDQLAAAAADPLPAGRAHALTQALLAAGGVLHLLQDMASPTHVRNDYAVGHLQPLGSDPLNRGSAYERAVSLAYGQFGIPAYRGARVIRKHLKDFFSSPDWSGLADRTSVEHFSPGTLPPTTTIVPQADARELRNRLSEKLAFSQPALGPIDLGCARRRTCYQNGPHGPQLAYRLGADGKLRFFLDDKCLAASARRLLPLAVGFSTAVIDFLFRGTLSVERQGEDLIIRNAGVPLSSGRARLFVDDGKGQRRVVATPPLSLPAPRGGVLFARRITPELAGKTITVLFEGTDESGERLVATSQLR